VHVCVCVCVCVFVRGCVGARVRGCMRVLSLRAHACLSTCLPSFVREFWSVFWPKVCETTSKTDLVSTKLKRQSRGCGDVDISAFALLGGSVPTCQHYFHKFSRMNSGIGQICRCLRLAVLGESVPDCQQYASEHPGCLELCQQVLFVYRSLVRQLSAVLCVSLSLEYGVFFWY